MEGCFLNRKHGPISNVLQIGTAARGQCQFAVGEPRHIFLNIFLCRLHLNSCSLSCIHSTHLLTITCHGCSKLTEPVISPPWKWFWGCVLGQQHEHNLCLSPGLWGQQLLLLGWFAYGLGMVLSESTVLHGWGQKICLLWTCSHLHKTSIWGARRRLIKEIMIF